MVDPSAFAVGRDLAVSPGAVVMRTPVFELLQYQPTTATVSEVPLLIVPPTINKYYVTDLAPGRSLIEYLVGSGQQVFAISWRNPEKEHADWGMDTYGSAVIEAMDAAQQITGSDSAALFGLCSGGILCSMVVAHLAHADGLGRVAALALAVTVLDQHRAGLSGALLDRGVATAATMISARRGFLDGRALAEVFAWLRPNDLIWNYWVSSYLLDQPLSPFDVLAWNADTTRMTAALHRDFIELAVGNALVRPAGAHMLGSPVDLSKIDVDSYVVAGVADHLCRWQNCYSSTGLLGGHSRFILSTSGHVAAIVNPPGNARANFRTAPNDPDDAEQWLAASHVEPGSWWPDFASWLAERGGGAVEAPTALGGKGLAPLAPAPGMYVCSR